MIKVRRSPTSGSRLCLVCLTKFEYTHRNQNKVYCHKKCVTTEQARDHRIQRMGPMALKKMLNKPNRTMFVGFYAEGDVL